MVQPRVSIILLLDFRILLKLPLQIQQKPSFSIQDDPEKRSSAWLRTAFEK